MVPEAAPQADVPPGDPDEKTLLLAWLGFLRAAVLRKVSGLDDAGARWRPDGHLLCLLGIVHHLTYVEERWIDRGVQGLPVPPREESEFEPGPEVTLPRAVEAYRRRAVATDDVVRASALDRPCSMGQGTDLRWVLLHLINETGRHAGHADATRELLDGLRGE